MLQKNEGIFLHTNIFHLIKDDMLILIKWLKDFSTFYFFLPYLKSNPAC